MSATLARRRGKPTRSFVLARRSAQTRNWRPIAVVARDVAPGRSRGLAWTSREASSRSWRQRTSATTRWRASSLTV